MASEVRFHEDASSELEGAVEWYLARSEFAATHFVTETERAIQQISDAPQRWPKAFAGVRRFSLRHFPFAIYYREVSSGIEVLAVAHGRRRPAYWSSRL